MEESGYKKIYEGNFIVVQVMVDRLEEIGITPVIKDEKESGRLTGFPTSMQDFQEVYVRNEEYDKALPIVSQVKSELTTEEE